MSAGKAESTDNSTQAITFSIILYILYFMYLKPVMTLDILDDPQKMSSIINNTYSSVGILFICVLTIQILFNALGYQSKCHGNLMSNFGKVFSATFFPWAFIMGSVMVALLVFPGFKGAFSNVLGYYAVASSSNDILVKLLGSSETNSQINDIPDKDPKDSSAKEELTKAAGAVVKIIGNTSLLVNQITPTNFSEFWETITPLIRPELQEKSSHQELKEKLLENVVLKDNIGEACWYLYTTILLVTVVKSNIAELPCATSVAEITKRMDTHNKTQDAKNAKIKKKESVTYTS